MARLLYKLGLFSARKAWLVVISWLILLGTAVGLMVNFAGKLSSSMSIEGIESQLVIDRLQESFPEASRGQGQIVFHKPAAEFTDAEKELISEELLKLEAIDGVAEVIDPFATAEELAKQRADVAEGDQKLADARSELAEAEKELADGKGELLDGEDEIASGLAKIESGQAKIDKNKAELAAQKKDLEGKLAQVEAGIAQLTQAGAPQEQIAPLVANQQQILGGLAQIAAGEKQLEAAQAELDAGERELIIAETGLEAGKDELAAAETKIADGYKELAEADAELAIAKRLLAVTENFGTISENGLTAIATVQFDLPVNQLEPATTDAVVEAMTELRSNAMQVEFSQALTTDFGELLGPGEIVGLVSAAIVLFVMLGSMIAAGLPVLSAILGVGISASITMALSGAIEMTSTTPILGVMLGLAVGIDYSLFLLNRHRKQLKTGMDLRESIALSTGTSGNAVLFAGLTVIIALAALNLTGIGFLGLMGTMGAVAIALAVTIAITFTPALMSLIGMRVLNKKERAALESAESRHDAEQPKNALVPVLATKHPWLATLAVGVLLVVAALPASQMRLGLPDGSSEPIDSTTYKSFQLVSESFGEGANGSITAVVTMPEAIAEEDELELQADIAEKFFALDNVSAVLPAAISEDQKTLLFQIIPSQGPATEETEDLVHDVRDLTAPIDSEFGGLLGVTGMTATNIDISEKLAGALPLYLGTVLALSLLLLILVFRSILVPLLATAGFLLTVFATFGAVVAVYQWGWLGFLFDIHDPGPILNFLPTILIGILFGLAMDYQLFLASGIREAYVHGKSPKDAINYGIHLSRAVVIAAALIMVTVFGGFAFNHLTLVRPIGFGLAIGVLIDAFLVRLILVPAIMSLLGKSAWWIPKWLDRLLPDVDVEGSSLERKAG
ncbi:MMPL family transporter [Aquiluna sp. KACHI24]|uniref:MMPL family transporter n=1 Tax=Aquiluna sp. KACHI24 TaxID=2968831 RepID=UPI00220DE1D1|nr:MMPL family transporter [Aquiluna sp. KACHI24]BDQ00794.1 membrane protein [Aquiluna sp. KACHI24]